MEKLKQYWTIILVLLIILGGFFYWYELRPANIRKDCTIKVSGVEDLKLNEFDVALKVCLYKYGIKE